MWNAYQRAGLRLSCCGLIKVVVTLQWSVAKCFCSTFGWYMMNRQNIMRTRMSWFNFGGGAFLWNNASIICLEIPYMGGIWKNRINCVYDATWTSRVRDLHILVAVSSRWEMFQKRSNNITNAIDSLYFGHRAFIGNRIAKSWLVGLKPLVLVVTRASCFIFDFYMTRRATQITEFSFASLATCLASLPSVAMKWPTLKSMFLGIRTAVAIGRAFWDTMTSTMRKFGKWNQPLKSLPRRTSIAKCRAITDQSGMLKSPGRDESVPFRFDGEVVL